MPFQYPVSSVTSISEFLVPGLPYITGSGAFPPNGYVEVSFPQVTSTIKIRNTSPTGSFRIGFTTPAFDTGKYLTIGANSEISLSARTKRLFISGSALTGSFQIVSGLTGISTRELYEAQYSPLDEGWATLWIDASNKTSIYTDTGGSTPVVNSGDSIAMVRNLANDSNNAVQVSTSARPTWSTSIFGNGAIVFDGVDDFLVGPQNLSPSSGTPRTIFVVLRTGASGGSGQAIITNRTTTRYHAMIVGTAFASSNGVDAGSNIGISTTITPSTGACVISFSWYGSGLTPNIRLNRSNLTVTSGLQGIEDGASIGFHLGRNSRSDQFFTGHIAEIIWYDRQLTLPAIQRVEAYLKNKWGTP